MRNLVVATGGVYTFLTRHSGIGSGHVDPNIGEYKVETLNKLLIRLIGEYLTPGTLCDPDPDCDCNCSEWGGDWGPTGLLMEGMNIITVESLDREEYWDEDWQIAYLLVNNNGYLRIGVEFVEHIELGKTYAMWIGHGSAANVVLAVRCLDCVPEPEGYCEQCGTEIHPDCDYEHCIFCQSCRFCTSVERCECMAGCVAECVCGTWIPSTCGTPLCDLVHVVPCWTRADSCFTGLCGGCMACIPFTNHQLRDMAIAHAEAFGTYEPMRLRGSYDGNHVFLTGHGMSDGAPYLKVAGWTYWLASSCLHLRVYTTSGTFLELADAYEQGYLTKDDVFEVIDPWLLRLNAGPKI
jgi:hypothetical protein